MDPLYFLFTETHFCRLREFRFIYSLDSFGVDLAVTILIIIVSVVYYYAIGLMKELIGSYPGKSWGSG